jgi:predicted permease
MFSDIKYAFRQLAKTPGFTVVSLLTLALGIGANTAIFSALDAALLRPLPYPYADRLVQVSERRDDGGFNSVAGGAFLDWRENQVLFDSLALINRVTLNLRGDKSPVRLDGLEVSHEFLRVLGVQPLLGRDFLSTDDQSGSDNNVVILTEELWRSRFGANPLLLGTTIVLDDVPRVVIGIAPAGAWLFREAHFFIPAVLKPNTERALRSPHWAAVYGRLKPDVSVQQADSDLNGVKQRLQSQYPAWKKNWGVAVSSLSETLSANTRPALLVLLGAVVLVLFVACANVANLLLARGSERRQEIALRAALGATGGRLARQVLTESLLLATLGGGLGVIFSFWGIDLLRHLTADLLPRAMAPTIDARVLGFSVAVCMVTGTLFGLFPAWQVRRPDLNDALKNGGRSATAGGRQRTQSMLVVAELALTVMLLTGAGLLFRSMMKATNVDLGFEPHRALAFDLSLPDVTYKNTGQRLEFTRAVLERIRALPGVGAAGTGLAIPFTSGGFGEYLARADLPANGTLGRVDYVSGGYLEALGARLLAGRRLSDSDNQRDAARVMVVNQTAVQTFFPGKNPLGESISFNGNTWQIIGVIADIPDRRLDGAARPFVYCAQAFEPRNYSIVVRTPLEPLSLVSSIHSAIEKLDPGLPLANIRTLDQAMANSMTDRRLILGLIGAFAVTALLLACTGLYGVMAYSVVVRRRELCIRLVLGATPRTVRIMVLCDGMRLMAPGLVLGITGAFAGARLIAAMLFGVSAHDPAVYGSVVMITAVVGVAACWFPAVKAARSDLLGALRAE